MIESFITSTFGEDAWNRVVSESGVDVKWVSSCPYPDKVTYDLVITAAGILGVTVNEALEAYGGYFVKYVTDQGFFKLLKTLGSTVAEFLSSLNNLHLHLMNGQPAMNAPAFRVDNVTTTSCHLHYYSKRPGLWPIVVGVLKALSTGYLHLNLQVTLLRSREDGDDHETFLVQYPEQPNARQPGSQYDTTLMLPATAQGFTLNPQAFAALHPFHMLFDKHCKLLQFGDGLAKHVPGIVEGKHITDMYTLRHPHTDLTWEGITRELASSFVLQAIESGLELKGQMVPTTMPIPGCPVPKQVLLFLCSPRCANLDEMIKFGLYMSDIPLHDLSRDFVLLAEQRQAEADLLEKFEKLTLELKAEKARSDALVQRMSGLLACFPFKGAAVPKPSRSSSKLSPTAAKASGKGISFNLNDKDDDSGLSMAMHTVDESFGRMEVIEAVRRTLSSMNVNQAEDSAVEMLRPIGEGAYGKVFCGLWHGTEVAVKTIILPAGMSGAEKRERMAVMEAAISSTMSHPNIVQTYTYSISLAKDGGSTNNTPDSTESPMHTSAANGQTEINMNGTTTTQMGQTKTSVRSQGASHSYEVRLILELCDKGSLRDALDQDVFCTEDAITGKTFLNFPALLDTAMDVAKACIHLHRNSVIHCDIKARNVLLRNGGGGRGVVAKLSDFGLATKLPDDGTPITGVTQGTLTHMAPEVLQHGQISKSSDVYAFGILLWELYTGGHAFRGVNRELLAEQVIVQHRRPEFPPATPPKYQQLAHWCWNKDTHIRPTFEEVLSTLLAMRKELGGSTPPIKAIRSSAQTSEYQHSEANLLATRASLAVAKQLSVSQNARNGNNSSPNNSVSFVPTDSDDDGYEHGVGSF